MIWRIETDPRRFHYGRVVDQDDNAVAYVHGDEPKHARLIAAAPRMLAELRDIRALAMRADGVDQPYLDLVVIAQRIGALIAEVQP